MNFRTWTPLWSGVVDSSLWREPDYVIKVYLTLIALKDEDHIYRGSAYALADRAKKTEQEVLEALKILSAPDRMRKEKQDYDGRRIEAVTDGWFVLNGPKYREMIAVEMKRARDRRSAKAYRERKKADKPASQRFKSGEAACEEAGENGASEVEAMNRAQKVHPLPERKVYEDDPADDF